jgi:ribose transport system ATP-binding protein
LDCTPPILELKGLGKTFPGARVLDGVHFELRRGEVHVLLGENGAGKSTLAKIISGACLKSDGEIWLDNAPVEIKSPKHARGLGIGMIYQELSLAPNLTVAENIFLGREATVVPGLIDDRALRVAAQKLLDELGVKISAGRRLGGLGIAQQQMVEVARALSLNARILIMDEPTSALTRSEIRELFAVIRRLKSSGAGIIYISHRMEELQEIGDRVTVLRDGHSVATRNLREVSMGELIRLMVNRELKEQFPKRKTALGEELLRVEGLSQNGFLHNISFSLRRGEVLGLAGLLGSGRSRLARALFGVERVDTGAIFFKGQRRRIDSPRRAIHLGMGFLAEDRRADGLVLKLSVRENICLPSLDRFCSWGVVRRAKEKTAVGDYLQQLRIKTRGPDQQVMFLSGGNQQKVVLSKWLCSQAELFIFDEPTRGIDVGAKFEIYELINRLTASGAAVLMISSELPEILGMSDRILTMRGGAISGEFSAAEATQEKLLQASLGLN